MDQDTRDYFFALLKDCTPESMGYIVTSLYRYFDDCCDNEGLEFMMRKIQYYSDYDHGIAQMFDTIVASAKTAIHRNDVSAPLQWLIDHDLIKGAACNWGEGFAFCDTDVMRDRTGYAVGYDPMSTKESHRWPPLESFDTIYCGYVLNVLLAEEAHSVITNVYKHLNPGGIAYFAVRIDEVHGEPYLDGVITKRGTFQVSYRPYLSWFNVIHKTGHYAIFTIRRGS